MQATYRPFEVRRPASNRSDAFVCDMPAPMLKKNNKISKAARSLYATLRGLANGKTGELAIRGNPLDWKFIARAAEIGRDQWQRALRELIVSGWVTKKRERVELYKHGRKRNVLGRARYFVHKQPKPLKKPNILLVPDSPTVEGSGTQISSETPYCPARSVSPLSEERKGFERIRTKSSSGSPTTPDDDFQANSLESKANPFLPEEDKNLLMRIRKRLAELHKPLYGRFAEQIQDDDFMVAGIELVDGRGTDQIRNPATYFTTSLVEILIAANPGEQVKDDFSRLIKRSRRRRERRQKYMGQLHPLSAESEEKRQQFNRMVEGRCAD
jgi:hypothetical protein